MLKRYWKTIIIYAALPEMRLFWFFVPIIIAVFVINFLYVPASISVLSAVVLTLLAGVIFMTNLRFARSNLQIKVERNQMSSIIQNLRDGIIAYDTDFKILVFNRAAEHIFGVSAEAVVGKTFSLDYAQKLKSQMLMQSIFPSFAPLSVNRTEPGSETQIFDLTFPENGTELRVATIKIIDPAGKLLGFVKVVTDRSREVGLVKSKSDFITLAAHQLQTPATAIRWVFEELDKAENMTDENKQLAHNGLTSAYKLLQIVNDLLQVAKMEEGRFGYVFENVDLAEFLEQLIRSNEATAKEYGIKLYFKKPAEPANAVIDPEKLIFALNNILDNAIKYNVENGSVTVELSEDPGSSLWSIAIKDTGVGIPAEYMPKLFTKFYRGENILKMDTEGSGLGLYIAKNIVKNHGGDIRVESEVNRGTTFYISLPSDPNLIPKQELVFT